MAVITVWLQVEESGIVQALQAAAEKLDRDQGEVLLDISSMRRIDAGALKAMEEFASKADDQGVKVVLRGANVDVYKVLTLVRLVSRFSFVS